MYYENINPGQLLVGFTEKTVELCLKRHRGVVPISTCKGSKRDFQMQSMVPGRTLVSGNGEIFGVATIWGV